MTRRNRRKRPSDQTPGWVWMSFGLALGLLVAGIVYVRDNSGTSREQPAAAAAAARTAPTPQPPADESAAVAPASREATSSTTPATRFDFYEVLPQFEVTIPESDAPEASARQPSAIRAVEDPGRYMLQVGAFTALADADRRKATLALLGIESNIQQVNIGRDVFHRVRVGPIDDLDELNRIRGRLRDARIESLLMKATD